jgi:hypothetical protein
MELFAVVTSSVTSSETYTNGLSQRHGIFDIGEVQKREEGKEGNKKGRGTIADSKYFVLFME